MSIKITGYAITVNILEDDIEFVDGMLKATAMVDGEYIIDSREDIVDGEDVDNLLSKPQFSDIDGGESIARFTTKSLFYQAVMLWFGYDTNVDTNPHVMEVVNKQLQCTSFADIKIKYMVINTSDYTSSLGSKLLPSKLMGGLSAPQVAKYFDDFVTYGADSDNPVEVARQQMVNMIQEGQL